MRLIAQVVTVILVSVPLYAQQPQLATPPERPSSAQDRTTDRQTKDDGPGNLDLPVSLDKIREALAQPPPPEPLKGLNERPTFRSEVLERQRFDLLMDKLKFDTGGPTLPSGRHGYDH